MILKRLGVLRVPAVVELEGLDLGRVRHARVPGDGRRHQGADRRAGRDASRDGHRRRRETSSNGHRPSCERAEDGRCTFFVSLAHPRLAVVGGGRAVGRARAAPAQPRGRRAMPAIIDSAPDCVTSVAGAQPADDSADFIIQAAYENCAGIMTFGPGSTYGEEGAAAPPMLLRGDLDRHRGDGGRARVLGHLGEPPPQGLGRQPRTRRPPEPWTTRIARSSSRRCRRTRRSSRSRSSPLSIICAIVVLVIVLFTSLGTEFRPTGLRPLRTSRHRNPPKTPARITWRGLAAMRRAVRRHGRRRTQLPAVAGPASPRSRRSPPRGPRPASRREQTQVRLVRQGLTAHPFWAVSFSVPAASGDGYTRLATVRVDANTGEVAAVNRER